MSRTAAQALGYKELLAHLDGAMTLDDSVELIVVRTRQFAVRQLRWFRRDPRVRWVDVERRSGRRGGADRARGTLDVMSTLTLTKHHGLGNDFLVVFDPQVDDLPVFARRACDRRPRHRRRRFAGRANRPTATPPG